MTEEKGRKVRVAQLAKEINIPSTDLIAFLQKKGFTTIKTINSPIDETMMPDINAHYKNAIEVQKRHAQKVGEYKDLINKAVKPETEKKKEPVKGKKTTAKTEEPKTETPAPRKTKKDKGIEKEPEILPELPAEPAPSIEQPKEEVKKAAPAESKKKIKAAEPAAKETIPPAGAPAADEEPPPAKDVITPGATAQRLGGLKILGVMEDAKAVSKKEPGTAAEGEQDEKVIKKRKRKPKTKKKQETVSAEELLTVKKKQKVKRFEIDQKEIDANIRTTLDEIEDAGAVSARAKTRKRKKRERLEMVERLEEIKRQEGNKITVTEFIAVNELANLMNVNVGEVLSKCIGMGLMVSINQRLDVETITLVADEFGFEVEIAKEYAVESLEDTLDPEDTLQQRSAVVTIMGHVDHGKTSLLDFIRQSNIVAGESGRITQHIGAYRVVLPNGKEITFLDTPGHEAFTAMRARGAQVTDIVVLVVAADDAVMPQTVEAINHALAAGVPIVVAINKIDRPEANPERIRQQLADRNILVEDWGGKYQCVEISAKMGKNVDLLLEKILLEAEILELRANPDREARGVIVEAELDKGRGIIATVLVQKGTLYIGEPFIAGIHSGRVRAMFDERGHKVEEATPSTPVQVLGLEGAPQAGDQFIVVKSEREAKQIANKRQQIKREQDQKQVHHITLDEISHQIAVGGIKELPIIVKGDVDGSVEALSDSFMKLSNQEVVIKVIHRGVGAISEGDVLLADASNAIIIGFHVRPNINARRLAETQNVDIRIYNIIYDAINEVKSALEGLLAPVISEEVTATAEIRETFKVPKVGTVAGCMVQEGKLNRHNRVRLIRDGIVVFEGELSSLKRFKDDVREVDAGYECGLSINNYNDIKIGDIIESFKIIETKKKLA